MSIALERDLRVRAEASGGRIATCFGAVRDFLGNHFVYVFVSPRAGGLTVGVNLNPDRQCNFDCVYCEVERRRVSRNGQFSIETMAHELTHTLERVRQGHLRALPEFRNLPAELLELRHVALSGEGEPTLCPQFAEAVQAVVHVRALGQFPFFKIALLTNGSLLDQTQVQYGLRFLIHRDEIWLKLDAGSRRTFERINRAQVSFERVLHNILTLGQHRPIVIQSLFPLLEGEPPAEEEISEYIARLRELKEGGAQISLVQIYSATRPTTKSECRHVPLKVLSHIAQRVRAETGLSVEVF